MACGQPTQEAARRDALRIAVLVKQVPRPAELVLANGRLVRKGVGLETNAYCRRANARAVDLAGPGGEVVVFSMGPPSAEHAVREMIACGAARGVVITDPALAGSDTLITARVLAAAIRHEGPFDIVLSGAYSLDSETGHIGVQLAELLGLPFLGPCRKLDVVDHVAVATVESGGGFIDVEALLPTAASAAERLCPPSKGSDQQIAAVAPERIRHVTIADLGLTPGQVGLPASPTRVGSAVRGIAATPRWRLKTTSIDAALQLLAELAGTEPGDPAEPAAVLPSAPRQHDGSGRALWCVVDPTLGQPDESLATAVAAVGHSAGLTTFAYVGGAEGGLAYRVDRLVRVVGPSAPEDWAVPLADRLRREMPRAVVVEATNWGRELAARVAARMAWGLVGDAVELTVEDGEIVAWKSAFSGQALVPITSTSPTLLVTVRPGTLRAPAAGAREYPAGGHTLRVTATSRVIYSESRDVDAEAREISSASRLLVVGAGVEPARYGELEQLRLLLGAGPLAGTRRVTDEGWLPRSRQIGITGRSVAPQLVVSIGASGKFNHTVAFSRAARVIAINRTPDAPIFEQADVGIVGDWRDVVPQLTAALRAAAEAGNGAVR
ncbi:MAG TPA: FAD-binding protein [Actinospica sp.]|nr:FAD-binding protein [Actinospica sp.]